MPPLPPCHHSASISTLLLLAVPPFLLSSLAWKHILLCGTAIETYRCCHPLQLNYKGLQTCRPLPHSHPSSAQHRTPGFIRDVPRVQQLLGPLIALLPVLYPSFLFLHSAQGPEPPVAKGCVESWLHSASFCRQHGHRAPFRPHGQWTVCHPTGNTPSLEALFFIVCMYQVDVRMLQMQNAAASASAPGWSYSEECFLFLLLFSHFCLLASDPFIFHTSASLLTAILSPSPLSLMPLCVADHF